MTKILLVEDNPKSRDMLARRLQRKGYLVVVAEDGAAAVDKASAERPDLILMDLQLPIIDGWEATRRIKRRPETSGIPVVALTAYPEDVYGERTRAAGCDDYETKPIQFLRLTAKIDSHVGSARRSA